MPAPRSVIGPFRGFRRPAWLLTASCENTTSSTNTRTPTGHLRRVRFLYSAVATRRSPLLQPPGVRRVEYGEVPAVARRVCVVGLTA